MRQKPHYAWAVCLGCALLLFCTSGLSINAFTIFQPYILSLNNFTNTQSSLILTARNLFSLGSMLLAGVFYRRVKLRTGMGLAGLLMVLSFVLFGLAKSFFSYCLASALLGISYGLGTMIPVTLLLGVWFRGKRNTALGVCSSITGLSVLGIPSLLSKSVVRFGLGKTFLLEAACMAVIVLVSFLLIRNSPEEKGLAPYGSAAGETVKPGSALTLDKKDWLVLFPMLLLIGAVMNVAYSHLTVLFTGEGFSEDTAALAMLVSGLALMGGKILYGRLGDKIGNNKSSLFFAIVLLAGYLLFRHMNSTALLMIAVATFSFGIAYLSVGLSAWPGDLCPGEGYEKTVRRFQAGYAAGSLVFSPLPGIMADTSGGSYLPSYALFTVLSVLVFAAVRFEYRRTRKKSGKAPLS